MLTDLWLLVTYRETDDSPTILAKLNPPESVDDQKKSDEDQSNCELSDDVWAYIARQPNTRMKWVRAARTHCAALSVCEDGFPGYSRREILVRRAMRRATTVIRYPIETETIVLKELVSTMSSFLEQQMRCLPTFRSSVPLTSWVVASRPQRRLWLPNNTSPLTLPISLRSRKRLQWSLLWLLTTTTFTKAMIRTGR